MQIIKEDNVPSFCAFAARNGDSSIRILSGNNSPYGAVDKMLYKTGKEALGKVNFRLAALKYWKEHYASKYPKIDFEKILNQYLKNFNEWGVRS